MPSATEPARIDILIPTYNRGAILEKNLELVMAQVEGLDRPEAVRVVISDNGSTDDTVARGRAAAAKYGAERVVMLTSPTNHGLEANVSKLMDAATAELVMILGDDDFLPDGYLDHVLRRFAVDRALWVVIPGCTGLYPDGTLVPTRGGKAIATEPGFLGVLRLSHFGHQLSGVTFRREGVLEAYRAYDQSKSLYPFIFFVGYALQRGRGVYCPEQQVLVSHGNEKAWRYDDSGLLTHVYLNYAALYQQSPLRSIVLSLAFTLRQPWRMRYRPPPDFGLGSLKHILAADYLPMHTRAAVLGFFPVGYGLFAGSVLRNRLRARLVKRRPAPPA